MNDANVNRAEFIRARVSRRTKDDFDEICRELGKTPTEQMRELVEAFVRAEYGRLRDRLNVHIYHPADYAPEAWRVTMKLRDPTEMTWAGAPIPFPMPTVPMRLVASDDPGYVAITYGPNHMPALGGKFVNGEWRGHLYSNGCREVENPTSIEMVREALANTVMEQIKGVLSQCSAGGFSASGWLGVRLGLGTARGALIASVDDKGPAKPAGLMPGDVIVKFDGKDIKESRDLQRLVASMPVGRSVDVVVVREGKEVTKTVTLGRLEDGEK